MFFGDIMLEKLNSFIWGIASLLIILSGIYFTFLIKFKQFKFITMLKYLFSDKKVKGISSLEALFMTLGGRIGVGSIAGIALAIHVGGCGTIFWIILMSFIVAPLSYIETILALKYRKKDNNQYVGGPSYYIFYGLNKKKLAIFYSLLIIICYIGGFLSIQSNTISKVTEELFNINHILVGVLITIITLLVIFCGISKISKAINLIVPLMSFLYLITSIYVLIVNINKVHVIISLIINSAFNFKSFITGFLTTLIVGIQRGIFSSEAGLGTGAITSSIVDDKIEEKQGFIQMLGIYITTIIICGSTALIILTSNYNSFIFNSINGIEIARYAFNYHLQSFGDIVIFVSIALFSFSTILTSYYYGETSLKFIFGKTNIYRLNILKIILLILYCLVHYYPLVYFGI